ncbi:hypothetical protein [Actinospica robiniae]|uniref:hypothetical protein n=1 Tax=Actinospica robiniae TaxID=304901 RepID=UPI00041DF468|nr:hypothetical protein [Actinospica robiniae]
MVSTFVVGSVALGGAVAAHATTGISVLFAVTDSSNNGKLDVSLSAPSDVTSLQVSLFSETTQQTVATVTNFKLVSGTAMDGVWQPKTRIQLPALDTYRIDVSAIDADGDTLSTTGSGYFDYDVQTNLDDATVDRTTVDYQDRSVTMSGHLMGKWPATGDVTPLADEEVDVSSYSQYGSAITAADGSWSVTIPFTSEYQSSIQAEFAYDSGYVSSDPNSRFYDSSLSRSIGVKIKQTATKLFLTPSARSVPFQGAVSSTSATLLWDSPSGWAPLVGKTLGSNSFGSFLQETTDANGNAVFPATPALWNDATISAGWDSDDVFLADAQASSAITVVQPSTFVSFTPTRTDASTVTATGDLGFSFDTPGTIPVDIQFSATGKGGWTTVATVPNAWFDGPGYGFSITIPSSTAGFWRATFSGGKQFESATSSVVYLPAS